MANVANVVDNSGTLYLSIPKTFTKLKNIKEGDKFICINSQKKDILLFKKVDDNELF